MTFAITAYVCAVTLCVEGFKIANHLQQRQAGCVDAINNCAAYGTSICTDAQYDGWVSTNCIKTCNKCPSGTGGQKPGVVTVLGTGCVYHGAIYQTGHEWKDNCKYKCTCENGQTGHYVCKTICLKWDNLPPTCHMQAAPPGKCCEVPVCPPNVILQTPPGYVQE